MSDHPDMPKPSLVVKGSRERKNRTTGPFARGRVVRGHQLDDSRDRMRPTPPSLVHIILQERKGEVVITVEIQPRSRGFEATREVRPSAAFGL